MSTTDNQPAPDRRRSEVTVTGKPLERVPGEPVRIPAVLEVRDLRAFLDDLDRHGVPDSTPLKVRTNWSGYIRYIQATG